MPRPSRCRTPASCSPRGPGPTSSSLGCSAAALRAPLGEGSGERAWERRAGGGGAGLAEGGSPLPPLAHHRSRSSVGRRPRGVRALPLREPRDQLGKVAATMCGDVSLIRPLVGCESRGAAEGAARERERERGAGRGKGDRGPGELVQGLRRAGELQQVDWARSHAVAPRSPRRPPPLAGPTL